jgi:hypothetical protein
MPNLSKCITVNGRLCGWNKEKRTFFYIDITPITDKDEQDKVITAFMDVIEKQE